MSQLETKCVVEDRCEDVIEYPCLRQDDDGNVYFFRAEGVANAPAIFRVPGAVYSLWTSGHPSKYKPFKGTIMLTSK